MNKKGFTLLEVMLFLAISAALVVIAILGLGPRLNNARFTAAVRDVESNIASNIGNSEGLNNRADITGCAYDSVTKKVVVDNTSGSVTAGAANNCIANGVVALIDNGANRILYRPVVSLRLPQGGSCAQTDIKKIITCHKATLLNTNNITYTYINGLTQQQPPQFRAAVSNGKIGFGYLQDPDSTTKYPFIVTPKLFFEGSLQDSLNIYAASNESFDVCYKLGSRQAKVTFKNASLTPEVKINEGCAS